MNTDTINNTTILNHSVSGSGRSFVVIVEAGSSLQAEAEGLLPLLSSLGQISFVLIKQVGKDWRQALDDLLNFIDDKGIRSASFIAFGDSSVLIQALCLKKPKLLRTIVFFDGATRAHPSKFVKAVEKLEGFLPLGLPFRSDFPGFDGKPFLQRIRCPVLVGLSANADQYRSEQAELLVSGMPTSFFIKFESINIADQLAKVIEDFQAVPAKSPQKNLR